MDYSTYVFRAYEPMYLVYLVFMYLDHWDICIVMWVGSLNLVMHASCDKCYGVQCVVINIIITIIIIIQGINFGSF